MADRMLQFSAPMVLALQAGQKSETRRKMNPQPGGGPGRWHVFNRHGGEFCKREADIGKLALDYIPWKIGDRVWVREAWKTTDPYDGVAPSQMGGEEPVMYLADGVWQRWGWPGRAPEGRYRHAMHMPRWASRMTLLITSLRVARVQALTTARSVAEGMRCPTCAPMAGLPLCGENGCPAARWAFSDLWATLHGKDDWETNPWVTAIGFDVHRYNIDNMPTSSNP